MIQWATKSNDKLTSCMQSARRLSAACIFSLKVPPSDQPCLILIQQRYYLVLTDM